MSNRHEEPDEDGEPIALVLMKFESDAWGDKTYQAVASVVREAGLRPLRADEIRTSGPVVSEVCRLIESAELVIADSSGGSHSVSYEIGFAHGSGRDFETLIHLRSQAAGPIPFNYAHFRALIYRDRGHLKRILREHLRLSTPLLGTQLGFVFNLSITRPCADYGELAANAIIDALADLHFDGRCEYYAADGTSTGTESAYLVGLGCKERQTARATPDHDWWTSLRAAVSDALERSTDRIRVEDLLSEMGEMSGIRESLRTRGAVDFRRGIPQRILSPKEPESDSSFIAAIRDRLSA